MRKNSDRSGRHDLPWCTVREAAPPAPAGRLALQLRPAPGEGIRALDGTLSIGYGPHTLGRYEAQGHLLAPTSAITQQVA